MSSVSTFSTYLTHGNWLDMLLCAVILWYFGVLEILKTLLKNVEIY